MVTMESKYVTFKLTDALFELIEIKSKHKGWRLIAVDQTLDNVVFKRLD